MPDDPAKTVLAALLILYKLVTIGTVNLNKTHANVLMKCHQLNAYESPIKEANLLSAVGCTSGCIDDLAQLGCLELIDGNIWLKERVLIQ